MWRYSKCRESKSASVIDRSLSNLKQNQLQGINPGPAQQLILKFMRKYINLPIYTINTDKPVSVGRCFFAPSIGITSLHLASNGVFYYFAL